MKNNRKYSSELRSEAVLELLEGKRKVKDIEQQLEKTKRKLNFLKRRDF